MGVVNRLADHLFKLVDRRLRLQLIVRGRVLGKQVGRNAESVESLQS